MFSKNYSGKIAALAVLIAGLLVLLNCERKTQGMVAGRAALPNPSGTETGALPPPIPHTIVNFSPIVEFHGEAFPVKILATASMKTNLSGTPA